MPLLQHLKELDRRYAWSLIGTVLAVFGLSLAVYSQFIDDKRPELQFDILTNASVLDVKEQLSNLSVMFDGVDIRKQGKSLSVITARISNPSSKDILKGHYDDLAPLGLNISSGKVIRAELIDASNDYLKENFKVEVKGSQEVTFPSVILEAGESLSIKLLVLHKKEEIPSLLVFGKIAGIRNIPVRDVYQDAGDVPFYIEAFWGSFFVQAARTVGYFFGALFIIVAIAIPTILISEFWDTRKREKAIKEFKAITDITLNDSDEFIFSRYVGLGEISVLNMLSLIEDNEALSAAYNIYLEHKDIPNEKLMDLSRDDNIPIGSLPDDFFILKDVRRIRYFLSEKFIRDTGKGFVVERHMMNTVKQLHRFLSNRGLISSKPSAVIAQAEQSRERPSAKNNKDKPQSKI